jgi:hypothetical protein
MTFLEIRMIRRFTRPALLVLALAGTTAAFAQTEVEPNGSFPQATALPGANSTVTGTFALPSPNNDLDFYSFTLNEISSVTIRVWGPTIGDCPTGIDPILALFDSGGQQIAFDDDTGSLCPLLSSTTQPVMGSLPIGTYYVRASLLNTVDTARPYTMVMTAAATPLPITERFTYQGKLDSAGAPVNGETQMVFSLWTHPTSTESGSRLSLPILQPSVGISEGLFTVDLDFTIPNTPGNFNGTERYLQIEIADLNGSGNRVVLEPRQRISAAPHAVYAMKTAVAARATLADNATNAASASYAQYSQIAQSAESAYSADTATTAATANTANSVPWSGIIGKPSEFADNDDGTGGWTEEAGNGITYTIRNVGIGTFNPGSFDLAVGGSAAKTGGGSWSVFCDERLKHDIKPMAGTLDRLLQLRGYTFEYNASAVAERLALPGTQIGLMAQEVEQVFPDWVAKDEKGYRYVTERATTALMVEALRDLRNEKDREIDAIKAQAAKRELENQELKARLERLEKAMNSAAAN